MLCIQKTPEFQFLTSKTMGVSENISAFIGSSDALSLKNILAFQ